MPLGGLSGVVREFQKVAIVNDAPIETVRVADDVLYVKWLTDVDDLPDDAVLSDGDIHSLFPLFSGAMEEGGWPRLLKRMVVEVHPQGAASGERGALRFALSREHAREHHRGDLTDLGVVEKALEDVVYITPDGDVEPVRADVSIY